MRIPGEFETQESIVFGCGQLVRHYPQTFVDLVNLIQGRAKLFGVIDPSLVKLAKILLATAGLPQDCVTFMPQTTSSMWVRDFSPVGAVDRKGNRVFLNFHQGHMRNRNDIGMIEAFKESFPGEFRNVDLNLEGGNLISNGSGLLLSSQSIIVQNQARGDLNFIAKILDEKVGGAQWAAAVPLVGERTGHIDLMAAFLSPTLLVVGEIQPNEHPENAKFLNDLAKSLNGMQTSAGKIKVERIPMPYSADTYFRSYCNVLFANGLLVVPIYPSINPKMDQMVLKKYAKLMPKWKVVGLDCEEISRKGGSLHCMTMNAPPRSRAQSVLGRRVPEVKQERPPRNAPEKRDLIINENDSKMLPR